MPVREQNSWAEELRFAREMYVPSTRAPEATPPDGPDPYGPGDDGDGHARWLDIDWRAELRNIDVNGARANYVDLGAVAGRETILFVHGLGGSWQNWLENLPHFSDSHRVVAVDLPGFGSSPMPPWEISIAAYGRFIHDFCYAVGIEKATVVGSSLGGFVTSELAISEPHRVERQVLVSSAGVTWSRARREPAQVIGRIMRAAAPLAFRYQMEGLRRPKLRQRAFQGVFHDPGGLDPRLLFEVTLPALQAPGFYDAMTTLVGYDIRERLEEIEVPTLIIWGRNDRVVPVRSAPYYKELIGDNAELVIFAKCGHVPMLERPVRFNRVLEQFLSR